jgi:nicotinic acid mononucleotide adenylyltransferase
MKNGYDRFAVDDAIENYAVQIEQLEKKVELYQQKLADTMYQLDQAKQSCQQLMNQDAARREAAENIARLAHVVGATRPGYDLAHARQAIAESAYDFDVTYLEVPALAISSSYLRSRVEAGQSLRYLTPDQVTGYIHKHQLYGVQPTRYGSTAL